MKFIKAARHFAYYAVLIAAVTLTMLDSFVIARELEPVGVVIGGNPEDNGDFTFTTVTGGSPTAPTETTTPPTAPTTGSPESSSPTTTATEPATTAATPRVTTPSTSAKPPTNAVITADSYEDENISINIETIRRHDTQAYIAEVKIVNLRYFKTALANNTFGRNISEPTTVIAKRNNAILAINGDFYGFRRNGFVAREGVLYRSTSNDFEALVMHTDGTFSFFHEKSPPALENILNIWSFGPALVTDSQISVTVDQEIIASVLWSRNPRTAVGIIAPGHYIFFVSDGRTAESEGLSLYNMAEILLEYGCIDAYNLDGGGSSTMVFNGKIVNKPTPDGQVIRERRTSDILYIGY